MEKRRLLQAALLSPVIIFGLSCSGKESQPQTAEISNQDYNNQFDQLFASIAAKSDSDQNIIISPEKDAVIFGFQAGRRIEFAILIKGRDFSTNIDLTDLQSLIGNLQNLEKFPKKEGSRVLAFVLTED